MAYNVPETVDYRYLKRYLKAMRKVRMRRERAGLCLLLLCAAIYLGFAGAYRDAVLSVREDHRVEYVLPGHAAEGETLQLEFNLLRGRFRITRVRTGAGQSAEGPAE